MSKKGKDNLQNDAIEVGRRYIDRESNAVIQVREVTDDRIWFVPSHLANTDHRGVYVSRAHFNDEYKRVTHQRGNQNEKT